MPNWHYAGDRSERIAQAVAGIEERCRRVRAEGYEADIKAFVAHQLPLIYPADEPISKKRYRMRPNWVAEEPPREIKYVLDAMWFEWKRAQARWGEIIHALQAHLSHEEMV